MTDRSRSPIWSRALLLVLVCAAVWASPLGSTSTNRLGSNGTHRSAVQHRTRFISSQAVTLPASSSRATKPTFTYRFKVAVAALGAVIALHALIRRRRRVTRRLPARVTLRVRERRPPLLQIAG